MSELRPQTILVTGGAGFVGSNLADRLAADGHRVRVFDALSRPGVESNLEWLTGRHGDRIEPVIADVRDSGRVAAAARGVDAVFHFAAQVAVTTSMADPAEDLAINIGGTFNLLEAIRAQRPRGPVIFASTNKVYGDLSDIGMHPSEDGYVPADARLARRGVSGTASATRPLPVRRSPSTRLTAARRAPPTSTYSTMPAASGCARPCCG